MRSLQDYRNIYREIADNLNLQGASVELLVQFLSQASYISEVQNISYVEEASLEKATLMNSKIEHCMDEMYSVFRGTCPRVIMSIKPSKYMTYNPFDELISSNSFKVYYLGYFNGKSINNNSTGTSSVAIEDGFIYRPISMVPGDTYIIIGLLASEVIDKDWTINDSNTYYVQTEENGLSNDMWVKINGDFFDSTRVFTDHIERSEVFDLTIPGYGSRLYVANILKDNGGNPIKTPANTGVSARYYKLSNISDYNLSEIKKINLKGAEFISFEEEFLNRGYAELVPGLIVLNSIQPDTISTIHYKANRDRYMNSLFRSNTDIGRDLQEMYPNKVMLDGTSYKFETKDDSDYSKLIISYVPVNRNNLLTTEEINDYTTKRAAYYVTPYIEVNPGRCITVYFNIDLELYQPDLEDVGNKINSLLVSEYGNKFGIELKSKDVEYEIRSLISKISNVKMIKEFSIDYIDDNHSILSEEEVYGGSNGNSVFENTYFDIHSSISTSITTKN